MFSFNDAMNKQARVFVPYSIIGKNVEAYPSGAHNTCHGVKHSSLFSKSIMDEEKRFITWPMFLNAKNK